ncbi:hypothetical protein BD410DRAFT_842368 [Rickenella mellea]|uniref:DUF6534 domain-containing protein n=1 Tax=Rickenella mellea TaxID=50990 RepID=A0A4Y7PUN9_9AGAM|nr:hypothetical protein BD410DRAFT_842368 [Rickenella mellea]
MSLGETYGAALIGLVVSAVLYGLTVLQTYHYYRTYPRDSKNMKWFVGVMWAGDTEVGIISLIQTDANAVVGVGVQMFFARRVWKISRQKFLTAVIFVLSTIHGTLGIYFTTQAFILKSFAKYKSLTWVTCVGLGSAAAADILIAVSLCYYLHKSRTGFVRTDTLITTLMMYAINTGLLTSIAATLSVFAAMPNNFVWMSFFWSLGRLYINSFLATLNSRERMRGSLLPTDGTLVQLSQTRSDCSKAYRYPTDPKKFIPSLNVKVETTKEERADFCASPRSGDIEYQTPSSAKDFSYPNSPNVHAHLSFLPSPPSPRTPLSPPSPTYKC